MESKLKSELHRIVKTLDGKILLDKTGKLNGRGAYICYSKDCLEKAIKGKKFEKEFEVTISEETYNEIRNVIGNN